MLKDSVNAEIKKVSDDWMKCVEMMEREPGRLAPDFKSLEEYKEFALENRAASEVAPIRHVLVTVEELEEYGKSEDKEFARELLAEGELSRVTSGWVVSLRDGRRAYFTEGGSLDRLQTRLPGDDAALMAAVRNAHRHTSEILGYSNW